MFCHLKKGVALCMALVMMGTSLSACSYEEEDLYQPVADQYEDDRGVLDGLPEKMVSSVIDGLGAGAKQVGTSVLSWAAKGILNSLGFNYGEDQTQAYVKQCLDKLNSLTDSISDIQSQLKNVEKLSTDNKYMQVFQYFQNRYDELKSVAESAYKTFAEMNWQSEDKPSVEELSQLCSDFADTLDKDYGALENELLQFGYALRGNTSTSSTTTKYSIMDTMQYFAESETPFRNQRYAIEDSILVPSMMLYDYGRQMVEWHLGYQLESYGVTNLYLAADGTIIGFTYQAPETGEKTEAGKETDSEQTEAVTYQCLLSHSGDLADYQADLQELKIENAPVADFTKTAGLKAYNLGVRFEQLEKQRLAIWDKYDSMPREESADKTNVLETLNNQTMSTDVKTVTCADFLSVSGGIPRGRPRTRGILISRSNLILFPAAVSRNS